MEHEKYDLDFGFSVKKAGATDRIIALSGNPNVGKSTVFNALTGMKQHTGNWAGKTVSNAQGRFFHSGHNYILVDIPGTYSLMAHSAEEEVARDFICFGGADAVIVVCDATCLERNMNLVLQTMEITGNVVVCINLMDEAKRKGISVDSEGLATALGVPVAQAVAKNKDGLKDLLAAVDMLLGPLSLSTPKTVTYKTEIEMAISSLQPLVAGVEGFNSRWLALRLIDYDEGLARSLERHLGYDIHKIPEIKEAVSVVWRDLAAAGYSPESIRDSIVGSIVHQGEELCSCVTYSAEGYNSRDRRLDKILTGKLTGVPVMLLLLAGIFWITIAGANYPSQLLSAFLFSFEEPIATFLSVIGLPAIFCDMLAHGMYRVLANVVAVMLPPMAIFFPLFTILEDFGYLPRVAFNLDNRFKRCGACGKQSLTMCLGLGCNAVGVVGCRIIDSPRERLIAIITNNFIPCNGRFPTLIAIITMFFVGTSGGIIASLVSAGLLTSVIFFGVIMTFLVSRLLSQTMLKGVPSSFTLELPPYRRPQFGKVIVRSILDRTVFVLGRAIAVAAPAGLIIWVLSNTFVGESTILLHFTSFLDPFARLIGLDGVMLAAFILGLPANEIVLPIAIMAYMEQGVLMEMSDLGALRQLLVDNGWTWITAVSTMLFSLMHWPCSTTCLTIKQETKSLKWTAVSIAVPTVIGILVCFIFATLARFFIGAL